MSNTTKTSTPSLAEQLAEAEAKAEEIRQLRKMRTQQRRDAENAAGAEALDAARAHTAELAQKIIDARAQLDAQAKADVLDLGALFAAWDAWTRALQEQDGHSRQLTALENTYRPIRHVPGRGPVGGQYYVDGVAHDPHTSHVGRAPQAWSTYLDQLVMQRQQTAMHVGSSAAQQIVTDAVTAAGAPFTD